ncbi:hypothetical protein AGRA3207_002835 [Actinomadura graeca]|uniref:Phosphoadenosine phosphosulphate reductase domain-containing protein n=1 Tax=Actinomadura graeca TaxID=2750812 RepID=A0ABX8QT00_9ACTN|nr:hypothetical protein [Actinomadura graeca]QXJ21920.1 hypothetical protein AGRA3207_002835 [Actinomadura graeca]
MRQNLPVAEFENVLRDVLQVKRQNIVHVTFSGGESVPLCLLARRTGLRAAALRTHEFLFFYDTCPYCAIEPALLWLEDEQPFRGLGAAYRETVRRGGGLYLTINIGRRGWDGLWYRFAGNPCGPSAPCPRHLCPGHTPAPRTPPPPPPSRP